MLIKIAKSPYFDGSLNNSFVIYDKVDSIQLCRTQPYEISDNETLKSHLNIQGIYSNPTPDIFISELDVDDIARFIGYPATHVARIQAPTESLSDLRVYRYNCIQFTRDNKSYYATFDTIAYICNDEGKTLEKCFAGGVLNK